MTLGNPEMSWGTISEEVWESMNSEEHSIALASGFAYVLRLFQPNPSIPSPAVPTSLLTIALGQFCVLFSDEVAMQNFINSQEWRRTDPVFFSKDGKDIQLEEARELVSTVENLFLDGYIDDITRLIVKKLSYFAVKQLES